MDLLKAPEHRDTVRYNKSFKIFLAGGIMGCRDWQDDVVGLLEGADIEKISGQDITLINPRRDDFDMESPNMAENQMVWEFDRLNEADALIFWFSKETLNPISLYELGMWGNSRRRPLFIGIEPGYQRERDVITQTQLAWGDDCEFVSTLEDLSKMVTRWFISNGINPPLKLDSPPDTL